MNQRQRGPVRHEATCEKAGCKWRAAADHPRIMKMAESHHRRTGHAVRVDTHQSFWWDAVGDLEPEGL